MSHGTSHVRLAATSTAKLHSTMEPLEHLSPPFNIRKVHAGHEDSNTGLSEVHAWYLREFKATRFIDHAVLTRAEVTGLKGTLCEI